MLLPARVVGRPGMRRRLGRVRLGFGDTPSLGDIAGQAQQSAGQFGVNLQQQGQATAQGLLQQLPTPVQTAVSSAGSFIAQGQPAITLAEKLASGQNVSSLEVVGAVGAAVGLVNPIAGAAIVAMGTIAVEFQTLLQGIFQAVGLYDPPLPTYVFNGLLRSQDTVPYAPFALNSSGGQMFYDPTWITLPDWKTLNTFMWHGDKNHMAPNTGGFPGPGSSDGTNGVHTLKESYLLTFLAMALSQQMQPLDQWAWANVDAPGSGGSGNWVQGVPTPANPAKLDPNRGGVIGGVTLLPVSTFRTPAQGSFEEYFNKLLILDLTYWANGQPFMPVRTLLYGAASAWNAIHDGPYAGATPCVAGAQNGLCYAPVDPSNTNDPRVQAAIDGTGTQFLATSQTSTGLCIGSTIEMILGPLGAFADPSTTLSNSPPLGINTGPFKSSIQAAFDTPAKIAAGSAGVVAGGVTAAAVYSFVSGQALGSLVSAGLAAVRDFFIE